MALVNKFQPFYSQFSVVAFGQDLNHSILIMGLIISIKSVCSHFTASLNRCGHALLCTYFLPSSTEKRKKGLCHDNWCGLLRPDPADLWPCKHMAFFFSDLQNNQNIQNNSRIKVTVLFVYAQLDQSLAFNIMHHLKK